MSVFDEAAALARRLGPVGGASARAIELYGRGFETTERLVLQALRSRLDAVAPAGATTHERRGDRDEAAESPGEVMAELLERSLAQDTRGSQRDLHMALLRQLVPDEARIIAALAQGPPAPLIHVVARAGGDRMLENASLIGRARRDRRS